MARDTIVLAGYFGFGNAGDEMILKCLLERLPARDWRVLSGRPDATSRDTGRPAVDRWSAVSTARAFAGARAMVLGGGELFQVRTSFLSLLYYFALVLWARLWGCEVFAFGMGVDPRLSGPGRRLSVFALKRARALWARDEATVSVLRRGGYRGGLSVAPDPVWASEVDVPPAPEGLRRVLWVLRFPGGPAAEAERWARLLNGFSKGANRQQGFMAFQPPEDMEALSRLRQRLDFFHRLETWKTPGDVFAVLDRYDAVVSMRYHGLVAAALKNRAVVAVAAHGKVAVLAESLGVPCLNPERMDVPALRSALEGSLRPRATDALRLKAMEALRSLDASLG